LRSVHLAYQPPELFFLRTNQPLATSQQYFFSLGTNQHQNEMLFKFEAIGIMPLSKLVLGFGGG
jgi:hypothetical protein